MQKIFRKKHILRWFACLLLALFLPLRAAAETPYDSYTYWNNDQGVRKLVSNRPMYEPQRTRLAARTRRSSSSCSCTLTFLPVLRIST